MNNEKKVNAGIIRLVREDITLLEIEAFVYYARPDLQLGSGIGSAIAIRGGPSIQEELKTFKPIQVGESVVTAGGKLKAKFIIHAVGPRFQEEKLEDKLRATLLSALKIAEEKKVEKLAIPPLGVGFYGVPLDVSATITVETLRNHFKKNGKLKEAVICVFDSRQFKTFQSQLEAKA